MSQSGTNVRPPTPATLLRKPMTLLVTIAAVVFAMTAAAVPAAAQAPDIMKVGFEDTQVDPLLSAACGEDITLGVQMRARVIAYEGGSTRSTGTFRFTYSDPDGNTLSERIAWQDFTQEVDGELIETEHGVVFNIHHMGDKLHWAGRYELNWATGELISMNPQPFPTFPDDYTEFICGAFA